MRRFTILLLAAFTLAGCGGGDNPLDDGDVWSDIPNNVYDNGQQVPKDTKEQPTGSTPVSYPQKRLLTRRGAHSYLYYPTPEKSLDESLAIVGPGLFWRQYSDVVAHLGVFSPLLSPAYSFRGIEGCVFEKYSWQPSHVVRNYTCGQLRVIETAAFSSASAVSARIRVQNDGAATAFSLRGRPGSTGLTATVSSDDGLPGARMTISGKLVNLFSEPVNTTWNVAVTSAPPATSTEVVDEGQGWSLNYAIAEGEAVDVVMTLEVGEGASPTPTAIDTGAFYSVVGAIDDEIEAWFEQAPNPAKAASSATYATSWYLFWENTAGARGNWSQPVITPSKRQYFRGTWQWDAAFHALALSFGGPEARLLAQQQLLVFLTQPLGDGHFPREIWTNDVNPGMQPPGMLTWAVTLLDAQNAAAEEPTMLMSQHYEALKANHDWFMANTDSDKDGNHEWSGMDSGWDTSPRWDGGDVEALDLMCWLYLDATLLSGAAQKLARLEDAMLLSEEAALLKERIQTLFWNPASNFFYDLEIESNGPLAVKTPATYLPLLVGAATGEQAQAVAAHLTDASVFGAPYPLPSVAPVDPAYDSDNYWRGPVWVVLNAFTIWGLQKYGLDDQAEALRSHTFALLSNAPTTYEYYDSQTGEGLGAPNFMWSGAFYVLLEGSAPVMW